MASIATIVTRGFGSFGDVSLLPTWGYGSGAAVALVLGPYYREEPRCFVAGGEEPRLFTAGGEEPWAYTAGGEEPRVIG